MNPTDLKAYSRLASRCDNTHLVLPIDVSQKRLCIIGEALGADEEANGEYFCGKAGNMFNKLLKESGLIREAIHVTNVVKVRPPDNKLDRLHELNLIIEDFIPYLQEELSIVQPKAILALGATAMTALTGKLGITKWRGSIVECSLVPSVPSVLITFHPSYIQRGQWHLYPYVRNDFINFAELAFGLAKTTVPFEMVTNPSITQILDYLSDIRNTSTETCIDIETVNKTHITCIGFSKNPNSAICIPFRHQGMHLRWSKSEQLVIIDAMKQVYQKPGLVKIGQNFLDYDAHYLLPFMGFPREPIFDTLYAHQLIHPDARHDLGFIMSVYSDMPFHKSDFKDWVNSTMPHDETLWQYNCKDCIGTHRSFIRLRNDLKELDLYNFMTGYVMPLKRVLFEMEHRGVRIDLELRDKLAKQIEDDLLPDALWAIEELTGKPINPNSSKQVGEYLADTLHIPIQRTEKGNYSVDEDKLEELFARFPQHKRIMELIICTRKMKSKDLGTYLRAKVSSDGRMRTSYGITKTGRLSSGTNHHDEGSNLQNQPKRLRSIFIPDENEVFLACDLTGAEAFILIYLIKSQHIKQRMLKGEKLHAIVANMIDGKPIKDLTPERYRDIKSVVYASNYGAGVRKFATVIKKTVAEAKVLRDQYFSIVPEIPQYHEWIKTELNTKRSLSTCYGRTRTFTGMIDDEILRSANAQIPQSTIADTINIGILGLWLIKPPEIKLLMQIHDEVVMSLPRELVDSFTHYIRYHLETLRELWIGDDLLVVPIDIGKPKTRWYGE